MMQNNVYAYVDGYGKCPYESWLASLKDKKALAVVLLRIDRMELGLLGDTSSVGEGVNELRIHYGPGYRVYYAQEGKNIYLLLCGGDKSSQDKDIKLARKYWSTHKAGGNRA
ncbi:MAG: type II toxin-antitoxin system RelE/ParE family toxin [Gammaproteobacteria bacterium]